jgi:chromosome segregation ATPase
MNALVQKLRDINLKIKALADQYDILKQENNRLTQESISLKKDLDHFSQERTILVRELESAKSQISHGRPDEKEKKATDKLLGQYIREVDKCINLMQEIS